MTIYQRSSKKQTFINGPESQKVQFEVGDGGRVKGRGRTEHDGGRGLILTELIHQANFKMVVAYKHIEGF